MRNPDDPDRGRALGVFPADDLSEATAVDRWLDGGLSVVVTFVGTDVSPAARDRFVEKYLTAIWDAGYVPVVTLEPWNIDGVSSAGLFEDGDTIRGWATRLADWVEESPERTLFLRPAHEMNGSWYPWSVGAGLDPADYRRAWRTMYDTFREAGLVGERVRWLWCINAETTADVDPLSCYPGDDYVDWVGVDGYNFGDSQAWSTWIDPGTVFESAFERLRTLTDAPLSVPEFGCSPMRAGTHDPSGKSTWITDAFDLFDDWDVRLAGWFNTTKETDWRVLDPAPDGDGRYPGTVRFDGTRYAVYPSFRRAAKRYLDGGGATGTGW